MEKLFDITIKNRKILYRILQNTPKEQLVKIPKGFRNSIWWNIAHVVVTQQLLVYKMSNLPMKLEDSIIDAFKKGTVPDGTASDEEIEMMSAYLFSTAEGVEEDYKKGVFQEFNEYTTTPKITLSNVEDAIAFNAFHEGIHLGVIISLQKALLEG